MKKVKSINGYTIYEATTQRDVDNYGCEIGSYNIYLSSDIRDYGLTNSYAEYDNIDSLTAALNICRDSKFAIACALADELSDSTIQDMDLCLEIERRFDADESVEYVRDCYDPETGILHAEPYENPSYHTWLDSVIDQYIADCQAPDDDLDDEDFVDDLDDEDFVDPDQVIDDLAAGKFDDPDIGEVARLQEAMFAAGYEFNDYDSGPDYLQFFEKEDLFATMSFETWAEVREWLEGVVFDDPDVSDAVERILHPERFEEQPARDEKAPFRAIYDGGSFVDGIDCASLEQAQETARDVLRGWMDSFTGTVLEWNDMIFNCWVSVGQYNPDTDEYDEVWTPEDELYDMGWHEYDEPRSHASYYVMEDRDEHTFTTHTVDFSYSYPENDKLRGFIRTVAHLIDFEDCGNHHVSEIVWNGEPIHYTGWQPGMVMEFASDITGKIVFSGCYPEWNH